VTISSSVDDSPCNTPISEPRRVGASAGATMGASSADVDAMPPPGWAGMQVEGPHGMARDSLSRNLVAHPNSPTPMSRQLSSKQGVYASRPVAVIISPDSSMPRKVAADVAAAWSTRDHATTRPMRKPQVRRLGWDVTSELSAEKVLARAMSVLTEMGIPFDTPAPALRPLSILTRPHNFSGAMGSGQMQALIWITLPEAQAAKATATSSRIDVARHAGDTFQFHAFYRELRDGLKDINGWDGMAYAPPPATVAVEVS